MWLCGVQITGINVPNQHVLCVAPLEASKRIPNTACREYSILLT